MDISKMDLSDYLGNEIPCDCGKPHRVELETVEISDEALEQTPAIIRKDNFRKPFIIADYNTYKVAGRKLVAHLGSEEIESSVHIFEGTGLTPNETSLGKLLMNYDPGCDLIIAVGAGTIIDFSRFFAYRLGLPYYIVATAPSTDAFASRGASLIKANFKTTFQCEMPKAIIADLATLAGAPKKMIVAGYSDILSKYTCLADWELSQHINDEYYSETAVKVAKQSLDQAIALQNGISNCDPSSVGGLMEALILSGIAMTIAGNSRPSAGSEHHLSHFWELNFLQRGKRPVLHGIQVGIATILVAQLYQFLRDERLTVEDIEEKTFPGTTDWKRTIKRVYSEAAPAIILLEEKAQKNAFQAWERRMKAIARNWVSIQKVLRKVPSPNVIKDLIKEVGGITNAADLGIDTELIRNAILHAKEVRQRYTILQLLWDLDLLSVFSSRFVEKTTAI